MRFLHKYIAALAVSMVIIGLNVSDTHAIRARIFNSGSAELSDACRNGMNYKYFVDDSDIDILDYAVGYQIIVTANEVGQPPNMEIHNQTYYFKQLVEPDDPMLIPDFRKGESAEYYMYDTGRINWNLPPGTEVTLKFTTYPLHPDDDRDYTDDLEDYGMETTLTVQDCDTPRERICNYNPVAMPPAGYAVNIIFSSIEGFANRTVLDVDLEFALDYPDNSDILIALNPPGGGHYDSETLINRTVSGSGFGDFDNSYKYDIEPNEPPSSRILSTVLDDDANAQFGTFASDPQYVTLPYQPTYGPLSVFNGRQANGPWSLQVDSTDINSSGTLEYWCLNILYKAETAASVQGFKQVETFDDLPEVKIDGRNDWIATDGSVVVTDPTDAENQVLSVTGNDRKAARLLPVAIPDSGAGTLFFRMRRQGAVDAFGGLSIDQTPDAQSPYEVQFGSDDKTADRFDVRDGNAFRTLSAFAADTWHCIWLVSNNQNNNFQVYAQGGSYTEITRLADGDRNTFDFRNKEAGALSSFLIRTGTHAGTIQFDDIYVGTDGKNTKDPTGNCAVTTTASTTPATDVTAASQDAGSQESNEPGIYIPLIRRQ